MVSLSGTQLFVIVIAVVLVVVVIAIFLYLANRLRARRNQILGELSAKPELIQDRAYNRLEMARREAALLTRTGTDVARAQDLIAQSQAAFDLHQFPRAYELAQSAHESLVNARGRTSLPTPIPGGGAARIAIPADPSMRVSAAGASRSASPPLPQAVSPPKNRAESHFQLGLLQADLASASPSGPTREATTLQQQAQAAFDGGEYTEAFRLALRGRRALGRVETLAPGPGSPPPVSGGAPDDVTGVAERLAGSERCPDCGYPMMASDGFCRGCGKPRIALTCPSCGEPRAPADTFCGRCGARFSP
ncbi:MAG: zinc ribbon domain-containing protein [Thermoplasmata archaeon]